MHTGQRQGDLLRLPWSSYSGTSITLRQGKAKRGRTLGPPVAVPCTVALRRMLDGMERTSPLILTTKTGQSFKKRYFARLWDETATAAGLKSITLSEFDQPVQLHFHDLRGTTVTLLSESGSTPQQIATITGHIRSRPCIGFLSAILRVQSRSNTRVKNYWPSSRVLEKSRRRPKMAQRWRRRPSAKQKYSA